MKVITIIFTSSTGGNPSGYSRGQKVVVVYHPTEPYKAEISGFFSLWGDTVIFGVLGLVFFSIGTGIILAGSLKSRKEQYLKT